MASNSGATAPVVRVRPSLSLVHSESAVTRREWDESTAASLAIFLRYIRRSLEELANPYLEPREVVSQAYQILSALVRREGGSDRLADSLGSFVHQLAAHEAPFRQLCHLYQLLPVILASNFPVRFEDLPFTHKRLQEIVAQILEWYVKRCTSILVLNEEGVGRDEDDTLFGLHVVEEREEEGMRGFEIVTGIRLIGHAGERLWCKVFFREGERFVSGSSGWCEQVGYGYSNRPNRSRVCSIVPIVADTHRVILDEVRLFVPYQALELHPGKQLLEVVVEITAADKVTLATAVLPHTFSVKGVVNPAEVPSSSPQLRGAWRRDFSKADGIRTLTAHSEGDSVIIAGTVQLQNRYVRSLVIHCEALTADGSALSDDENSRISPLSQNIDLKGEVSEELSFSFYLPRAAIAEASVGAPVTYEVTVAGVQGEIFFGARVQG